MRSDFSEKQCELYELKDKYQKLMESVQVEEEDRVRAHFIEKENLSKLKQCQQSASFQYKTWSCFPIYLFNFN